MLLLNYFKFHMALSQKCLSFCSCTRASLEWIVLLFRKLWKIRSNYFYLNYNFHNKCKSINAWCEYAMRINCFVWVSLVTLNPVKASGERLLRSVDASSRCWAVRSAQLEPHAAFLASYTCLNGEALACEQLYTLSNGFKPMHVLIPWVVPWATMRPSADLAKCFPLPENTHVTGIMYRWGDIQNYSHKVNRFTFQLLKMSTYLKNTTVSHK